jgi:hypothetical protein
MKKQLLMVGVFALVAMAVLALVPSVVEADGGCGSCRYPNRFCCLNCDGSFAYCARSFVYCPECPAP